MTVKFRKFNSYNGSSPISLNIVPSGTQFTTNTYNYSLSNFVSSGFDSTKVMRVFVRWSVTMDFTSNSPHQYAKFEASFPDTSWHVIGGAEDTPSYSGTHDTDGHGSGTAQIPINYGQTSFSIRYSYQPNSTNSGQNMSFEIIGALCVEDYKIVPTPTPTPTIGELMTYTYQCIDNDYPGNVTYKDSVGAVQNIQIQPYSTETILATEILNEYNAQQV